jgi:hypothetical protein
VPAKDRHHDVVVRALQKDGWTILAEQIALSMPARRLWIDIRAQKEAQNALILVEVKGFHTMASPVAYLADAIGQCMLYQAISGDLGICGYYRPVVHGRSSGCLRGHIGRRDRAAGHSEGADSRDRLRGGARGDRSMDTLSETLEAVMAGYAGQDLNGYSFLTGSADRHVFTVVSVGTIRGRHFADTSLVARVTNDRIVIDHDVNDKPLVDALVAAGIPRQQIVLSYAGESEGDAA